MRIAPEFDVCCHVCGTSYRVHNRVQYVGDEPEVTHDPGECPACGASIKVRRPIGVGGVQEIVQMIFDAAWYRKRYGTMQKLLEHLALNEADLNAFRELIAHFDFDAWERSTRASAQGKLTRDDRQELAIIAKARQAAAEDKLLPMFDQAVAPALAELRREHAQHMAIFQARKQP